MTAKQKEWKRVCEAAAMAPAVNTAAVAAAEIRKLIERGNGYEFEHIVAVFLTTQNKVVGSCVIGIGGFDGAQALPAILFKKFFTCEGATTVVIGHNHPSGLCTPSVSDHEFTHRIAKLAMEIGVTLLDSLIVTHETHVSIQ